jgi:hypothetical protein
LREKWGFFPPKFIRHRLVLAFDFITAPMLPLCSLAAKSTRWNPGFALLDMLFAASIQ